MATESLAFTIDGPEDAPVLVLSSSLGTTRDMWLPQLGLLSEEWRVVRFDHPGHGASPIPAGPVTVESIGRAVVDLLDRLELDRVSFCGISLGGTVGQWLAAHTPQRVERLILCSTSAHFAARDAYLQRAATVRERGMTAVSATVVERWFTPGFRIEQPTVIEQYRSMVEATPPEGYAAGCEAVAYFDSRDYLPAITAPTLVIAGAQDPATPVEHARVLVAGIPGARLLTIEGAAHLANVEQPAAVGEAIVHHLRGTA